jgi:hypothetical protein
VKSSARTGELSALLAEAATLAARAAEAAAAGNVERAMALDSEAEVLRRRARARARAEGHGPRRRERPALESVSGDAVLGARGPASSTRELTIAALNELGAPSAPRAVAEYIAARFGAQIDPRALAALRRDELRSWSSPRTQRPVYIVPALEGHRFLPLRGKLALSAWPLEARLIGPWSERVDHLRATINVARQARWVSEAQPDRSARILDLLARYAQTVGALDPGQPASVEDSATAELDAVGDGDREWRREAAQRAKAVLGERALLWGAEPPAVLAGSVG